MPFEAKLFLLALSFICMAFFAASETALFSLSREKVKSLSQGRGGRYLLLWLSAPQKILTAILVGIALFVILASIMATSLAFDASGVLPWSVRHINVVFATLLTFLIVLFGEIIPKTYARYNAEKLTLFSLKFLRFFVLLVAPVSRTIFFAAELLFRLFGMRTLQPLPVSSRKEF